MTVMAAVKSKSINAQVVYDEIDRVKLHGNRYFFWYKDEGPKRDWKSFSFAMDEIQILSVVND